VEKEVKAAKTIRQPSRGKGDEVKKNPGLEDEEKKLKGIRERETRRKESQRSDYLEKG